MARARYPTLSINTRMANYGVIYGGGRLDRRRPTWTAPSRWRPSSGIRRVVLIGYGLGANMVSHYQALRRPAPVEAVCTLAHPASLPDAMRERWAIARRRPSYEEMLEAAADARGGRPRRRHRGHRARLGCGRTCAVRHRDVDRPDVVGLPGAPRRSTPSRGSGVREMTVPLALIQPGSDLELGYGVELAAAARRGRRRRCTWSAIAGSDHTLWGAVPVVARGRGLAGRTLGAGDPRPAGDRRRREPAAACCTAW